MKKVFLFGGDGINWAIDKNLVERQELFKKIDNLQLVSNIFSADIIYPIWYDLLLRFYIYYPLLLLKKIKKIRVIAVITNQIQDTPNKVTRLRKIVDVWEAPNLTIYNYLRSLNLEVFVAPVFVETNQFKKIEKSKEELSEILGINYENIKDRLVISSFHRDSLGADLTRPKWQKNPDLLVDILEKCPKEKIILLLAGPRRHYIINQCKKLSIPYYFYGDETFIEQNKDDMKFNNISTEKINLLYNLSDLNITNSRSEGSPKAIFEASLTKTLIFSTPVGVAPDILHPSLLFKESEKEAVSLKIKSLIEDRDIYANEIEYNFNQASTAQNKERLLKIYTEVILDKLI